MNPSANSPTSDCTPLADPGSAAVVAHAAESSSGACTPSSQKPTCAACGSTNIHSYFYTSEFCQCVCDDCDSPLNADGSVWVEKQPLLPVEVPESETLWLFLTKGYSLNYIRESLVCGIPHVEAEARMLRDRARKTWSQIRAEVCA